MEYHLIVYNSVGHSSYFGTYSSIEDAKLEGDNHYSYSIIYGEILIE